MIDGLLEGIVEFAVVALGASTFQNLLLTRLLGGDHISRQTSIIAEHVFCIS